MRKVCLEPINQSINQWISSPNICWVLAHNKHCTRCWYFKANKIDSSTELNWDAGKTIIILTNTDLPIIVIHTMTKSVRVLGDHVTEKPNLSEQITLRFRMPDLRFPMKSILIHLVLNLLSSCGYPTESSNSPRRNRVLYFSPKTWSFPSVGHVSMDIFFSFLF